MISQCYVPLLLCKERRDYYELRMKNELAAIMILLHQSADNIYCSFKLHLLWLSSCQLLMLLLLLLLLLLSLLSVHGPSIKDMEHFFLMEENVWMDDDGGSIHSSNSEFLWRGLLYTLLKLTHVSRASQKLIQLFQIKNQLKQT